MLPWGKGTVSMSLYPVLIPIIRGAIIYPETKVDVVASCIALFKVRVREYQ